PQTAAPARLVYMSPAASGGRLDLEAQVLKDFNQSRPKGDVVVDVAAGPGGWGGLREKFIVSAAGGQPVAIVQNGWGGWMDLAEGGSIVELTPYFKRDRIDPRIFLSEAINEYSDGAKIWALPTSLSVDAIAYNIDLFDKAGLKPPPIDPNDKTWTMEKFLEYARLLTKLPDQVGFGGSIAGDNSGGMTEGTHFGQGPWDDAKKQSQFNTEGMRKGLQYWLDLLVKHHVQPMSDEAAALRGGMSGNLFLTGKVGMQVFYSQTDRLPFRWGLATLPYSGPPGSKNISGRIFAHALHMGQVKEKEAVWEVFKWLTKPENGGRFVITAGHATSPIIKGGSDIAQKAHLDRTGVDARAYVQVAQHAKIAGWGMEKYANWPKVDQELRTPYTDFRAGKMSVGEYTERAARIVNEQLLPKTR
ncbi:MAG: extracellular solute-binding protein, partial [Chloroflexi bacterium]|nr:extracellular solute-binding protein [Chloroflexota bacterium]